MKRLLLAWLLSVSGPLHAAVDADAWLERIAPALRQINYHGTLVYIAGTRMETLRVFHRLDGGRERERLVAITGPRREVIRDDGKVMCIGTGETPVAYDLEHAGRWSPALALAEAVRLREYRTALAGDGRVAGYAAQVIDVAAGDRWRYGYRLWLERRTGLPLRVDLLGDDGDTIEHVAFTQLALDARPSDADLQPSARVGLDRVAMLPPVDRERPRWTVPSPPPGFGLRAVRYQSDGVQLLYSDGLASVSVYVESAAAGRSGAAATQRGAVHAHSAWMDGWHVLAIGKVPAATVERFARGVRAVAGDG